MFTEVGGVVSQPGDPVWLGFDAPDAGQGTGRDRGREGIGKQLGTGSLGQIVAHRFRSGGESSGGPTQRFPQRRGDHVDLAKEAEVFGRSAPSCAQDARGVRVVHHQVRVVFPAQVDDVRQVGDGPLHGEDPVRDHHAHALVS